MSIKYNGGYIPAVGADGQILVADSSTSTGLRYNPTSAAGKNAIINGGMDIWQRGTSFTGGGYTADRWYVNLAGTCTVSQITSSLPSNFQYGIQWVANASNSYCQFIQGIEKANVIPLQGKTMTISGWVKASSNFVGNWIFQNYYSTSTDTLAGDTTQNGSNVIIATNATTTWTRFSVTFTVPSTAVGLSMNFVPDNAAQISTGTIQMTGVQLELGSTATTFSRAGGSIGGELALCQRYYYRATPLSNYSPYASGWCTGTTTASFFWQFPTTMRQSTSIGFSNVAPLSTTGGGAAAFTALTTSYGTNNGLWLQATGSSSLTTGSGTFLTAAGTTSSYIENNAEL